MSKDGYYLFDGGINYRDQNRAWNELRDGENVYWEGNLVTRLGYESRNDPCTGFGNAGSTWPSSGMQIIDHIRLNCASGSDQYFMAVSMADTGGTTDAIGFLVCSGLPSSSGTTWDFIGSATYTNEGVGQIIPWSTSDPFSWDVHDDKIWIGLGDQNPHILMYDGTSWVLHEYPLCAYSTYSGTGGSTMIITVSENLNTTADQDLVWGGTKLVVAGNGYVYVSDGKTMYWGITKGGVKADLLSTDADFADRTSGIQGDEADLEGTPGWDSLQFTALEPRLKITDGEAYKKSIFLYGEKGVYNFYLADPHQLAYDKSIETRQRGAYGDIAITDVGVFWVGKDGIYGYDGYDITNIGKKIWPQVESEHSDIPDDFSQCTLEYHKGKVYISFPDGTNKEVYSFDPDLIYTDDKGESHAPIYRSLYVASTGREVIGFKKLKEYDGHLYGISSSTGWEAVTSGGYMIDHIYELDVMGFDQSSAGGGDVGINFDIKTAYMDQEAPGIKKRYKQTVIETDEGVADGTTDGAYDLYFAVSINHDTGTETRAVTDSGVIDLELSTVGGHAFRTLDTPITTGGYILDGNSISLEFYGETSAVTPTTTPLIFHGFTLEYDMRTRTLEEVGT